MKLSEKTISIITPSFNQGQFIEETIKSVISQEGDFYIDYIIMDGGSTDESVEIIKKYDRLIRSGQWNAKCLGIELTWTSEKDKGQTDAINKGFQRATGEIVSWINSDDMYFSGAFAAVMGHFLKYPEDDFVFGDGDVINETGARQWEWLSRPYNLKLLKSYHFLWNDFTNYIMQQATFWRKRVFDKIGLLDESFHYAMDIEYWIRVGEKGLKLTHIPVKLGKFRMISGTKSLSSATVFWPESLEIFRRFNGAEAMRPFFVYYFFNEGLSSRYDLDYVFDKKTLILQRWKNLSDEEQYILKDKAEKAMPVAFLMLSNDAFLRGELEKADSVYKKVSNQRPFMILYPQSISYIFKKVMGEKISQLADDIISELIKLYRNRRYMYRYRKPR